MTAPSRYPLAWPTGRPRTKSRRSGPFKMQNPAVSYRCMKDVTIQEALKRLESQLELLGAANFVLSTGYKTRLDGTLILNQGAPSDPGAVVYFQLQGKPINLPCDTFDSAPQNVAALAAHLEATRAIERYGVATGAETLQAFAALPPPGSGTAIVVPNWRQVLGFSADFASVAGGLMPEQCEVLIRDAYRKRAKEVAGDDARLRTLNLARDQALAELK